MKPKSEQLLLQEIQVLLAERRTYYALLRTGTAIATLPLSILVFLLATVSYHKLFNHWWLALIVVASLLSASLIGVGLINQARRKLRKVTRLIRGIEHDNKRIADIMV